MDEFSEDFLKRNGSVNIPIHDLYNMTDFESLFHRMLLTGQLVEKYYTPLICFLGLFGNSLSVLVFLMDTKYRRASSAYYLLALAISDTGFLLSLFAIWLEYIVGGVITSAFMCPLIMYLGQVTCFVTVYITVAFSVERYIVVHFPLSRRQICTRTKTKIIIFLIILVALVMFSYVWIIAEVEEVPRAETYISVCTVPERYHKISEIANYVDSGITLVIPFFLITYFNVSIAIKVYKSGQERQLLLTESLAGTERNLTQRNTQLVYLSILKYRTMDCLQLLRVPFAFVNSIKIITHTKSHFFQERRQPQSASSDNRVNKTLLLISTVFLSLHLPLHVIRCAQFIQIAQGTEVGRELLSALQPWANMIFYTNFAINFLLYCFCGKQFRNALINIYRRVFSRPSANLSVNQMMTT